MREGLAIVSKDEDFHHPGGEGVFLKEVHVPAVNRKVMKQYMAELSRFTRTMMVPVFAVCLQAGAAGQERLPDPRYRAPLGVWEIDRVASMVAKASGFRLSGRIDVSEDPNFVLARVYGPPQGARIEINPRAAREIPPNSWAFIIGHEFAHQTDPAAMRGQGKEEKEIELAADLIGARYALEAGFKIESHVAWGLARPDPKGFHHYRMRRLAEAFRIPEHVIRRERDRLHRENPRLYR